MRSLILITLFLSGCGSYVWVRGNEKVPDQTPSMYVHVAARSPDHAACLARYEECRAQPRDSRGAQCISAFEYCMQAAGYRLESR